MEQDEADEAVEKNIRRTVALDALRKIGRIVAEEQRSDEEKARVVRWFARYGWMILAAAVFALVYLMNVV